MKLTTTPEQLLKGLTVGTQTKTHCQWCDHEFYEGDVATILVSRPADADHWIVHRTYCAACDPSAIAGPTPGCTELLAQCRLGTQSDAATQQTELVALEPELIELSEPAESKSIVETSPDLQPTPDESVSVEIETLPPPLSVPAAHRHPVTKSANEPAKKRSAQSNGSTD
jgi:hypothetical protein